MLCVHPILTITTKLFLGVTPSSRLSQWWYDQNFPVISAFPAASSWANEAKLQSKSAVLKEVHSL